MRKRDQGSVTPSRGLRATILACVCVLAAPVDALAQQPKGKQPAPAPKAPDAKPAPEKGEPKAPGTGTTTAKTTGTPKEKTFDFNSLDLNGRMRSPQLLYFLERANEELERSSLEKRSFIPHMVRSVDEETL